MRREIGALGLPCSDAGIGHMVDAHQLAERETSGSPLPLAA
jgi:hypothetical protein